MAINTITYTDKVTLNNNASIADINKCKAADLNEIKSVVNANANLMGDLTQLNTPTTSDIVSSINSIISSGSNTNGNYIKLFDGTMICYGVASKSGQSWSADGSLYSTTYSNAFSFPQEFTSTSNMSVVITGISNSGGGYSIVSNVVFTTSGVTTLTLKRTTSASSSTQFEVSYIAIGKWK